MQGESDGRVIDEELVELLVELHLLVLRWHRRDASTCPSAIECACRSLGLPRTEVNFDLAASYVAWVGVVTLWVVVVAGKGTG